MNKPSDRTRAHGVSPAEQDIEEQGFLGPAPDGIDAIYAWKFDGGRGEGLRFIDMELGWTFDHEGLVRHGRPAPRLLSGEIVDGEREHGTSVLGVVLSASEKNAHRGIAPNVDSVAVVSYYPGWDMAEAIRVAIDHLEFGDVLLLEAQIREVEHPPIEVLPDVFEAIRRATAKGIVVVEAAGNGGVNLDQYERAARSKPSRTPEGDSLAILVAAATAAVPHTPIRKNVPQRGWGTNFGSRVDCYAWGEKIAVCTSNSLGSTNARMEDFFGTSAAAAIIAGAALSLQGIALKRLGRRMSPREIRALLTDPHCGTASLNSRNVDRIGAMPDLRRILAHLARLSHQLS